MGLVSLQEDERDQCSLHHVKTWQEGSHLQARNSVLTRLSLDLDMGSSSFRTVRHE